MNFKNKKILITGATGGIGNCLIKKFNELGAKIVASGTNVEKYKTCDENMNKLMLQGGIPRYVTGGAPLPRTPP